jgi:hypothetical protein
MESTLIVVVLTVLRLGIPMALLLIVGEAVQRHKRDSA